MEHVPKKGAVYNQLDRASTSTPLNIEEGTRTREEIKKIIMTEIPRFTENDPDVRRLILDVTRGTYAEKEDTKKRIVRVLDELKRGREARGKKWDAQNKKGAFRSGANHPRSLSIFVIILSS